MKHKSICVSKKVGYFAFFVFALLLFVFINNQFLQTKTSYQSKAAQRRIPARQDQAPSPTPHFFTSAPVKIIEYWMSNMTTKANIPKIFDSSSVLRNKITAFANNNGITAINSLEYRGDLRSGNVGERASFRLFP